MEPDGKSTLQFPSIRKLCMKMSHLTFWISTATPRTKKLFGGLEGKADGQEMNGVKENKRQKAWVKPSGMDR